MRELIVSQKCKYALRAIFELALRDSDQPVKIQDIADSQGMPQRFLEVILSELKHGNFVVSKRGNDGGYNLARPARHITVGEVIRFLQGKPQRNVPATRRTYKKMGDYVFSDFWKKVNLAISSIYNNTTFADLVEQELAYRNKYVPNYAI